MSTEKETKREANLLYLVLWRVMLYVPIIGFAFGVISRIKDGRDLIDGEIMEFVFCWFHLWAAPILGAALYQHYFIHPIPLF